MFEIGSFVAYRSEGVCKISDIRTESFSGAATEYYILTPCSDPKSTVFVPVNNSTLTAFMRPLLSAAEFCALIAECRGKTLEFTGEPRARTNFFRETLSTGERRSLILLINTLNERFASLASDGKKPSSVELSVYNKAQRLIYEELAATTNIGSQDSVLSVLSGETELSDRE